MTPCIQEYLLALFLCRSRKGEVSDEIFDMLLSFTDFLTFKQAMLDYKAVSKMIVSEGIEQCHYDFIPPPPCRRRKAEQWILEDW